MSAEKIRAAAAKIARIAAKPYQKKLDASPDGRIDPFEDVARRTALSIAEQIESMPLPEAPKDERPEIRVSDDGVWLGFAATSGRTAIVNIEGYAAELLNRTEGKSIIAAALNEWCQEQRRAAGWRRSP